MAFSGYEDQRLPRDLDDREYDEAVADYDHRLWLQDHQLCRVCGDTVCLCGREACDYRDVTGTTVGGKVACLPVCVAKLVAEAWTEELAARAVLEAIDVEDDATAPISVRVGGVTYTSLRAALAEAEAAAKEAS